MSELAELFTSIAAIISAVGGMVVGVLALTRGSARERERAAQYAIDQLTQSTKDDVDEEQTAAIEEIRRRLDGES